MRNRLPPHCPYCGSAESRVTHVWYYRAFDRRRRVCTDCGLSFFTRQSPEYLEQEGEPLPDRQRELLLPFERKRYRRQTG